jgi:hypothetical protein
MARPVKDENEKRGEQVKIRLTLAEHEHLREQAELAGQPLAEYVRRRALGETVRARPARTDAELLRELNAVGVLLNQKIRSHFSGRTDRTGLDWVDLYDRLGQSLDRVMEAHGS